MDNNPFLPRLPQVPEHPAFEQQTQPSISADPATPAHMPYNGYVSPAAVPSAPPEPIVPSPTIPAPTQGITPQPVVQVLSPRGVEYVFLTISLFTGAIALIAALLALVNGEFHFDVLAFPAATLLVSAPIFSWLFLRLKKAELLDPALKLDASKRRLTQFTQIVAFLAVFFTIITFVSVLFAKMAGEYDGSILKLVLNSLVIALISGGILFYYWRDEHRLV